MSELQGWLIVSLLLVINAGVWAIVVKIEEAREE